MDDGDIEGFDDVYSEEAMKKFEKDFEEEFEEADVMAENKIEEMERLAEVDGSDGVFEGEFLIRATNDEVLKNGINGISL